MPKAEPKYVVVTTEYRGVFFGRLESLDRENRIATLTGARNCLRWSASVKGFVGLAASGPSSECRVGPACDRIDLYGVTSVMDATEAAVTAWEVAPW